MSTQKYKLYRKMSVDEYDTLVASGLSRSNSSCCPKKCFSESLVVTYRLNPYYSAITQVVAEIVLTDGFRKRIFEDGVEPPKPIHSDKTYSNYGKYENKNLFYRCHGNLIPLYNHEIDDEYIDFFNRSIININSINLNNYDEILLNRYLGTKKMNDLLTKNILEDNEYYIQLPFDLAILALKYGAIPPGGLNKFIQSRIIGKDYDLVDEKNHHVFPVTLAIKLNKNAFLSKIKNCFDNNTYNIGSDLIYNLSTFIEGIRLVDYKEERLGYRHASSILNKSFNMSDLLNKKFDSSYYTYRPDQIDLETALKIINDSKLKDYFINNAMNINGSIYPDSDYHGKTHAERVCLYAYLIASYIGLPSEQIKNVVIASLLHDIGRKSENDKSSHGKWAIDKLDELAIFTDTQESRNIIKFLIEAHSIERDNLKVIDLLYKYNIEDINPCLKLLNVLMDADALDRKRFTVFKDNGMRLEDSYLRIPISHNLQDLSELVSKLYYDNSGIVFKKTR